MSKIFDPKKLDKLNNPERLKDLPPDYIWKKLGLNQTKTIIDIGAGTGFFSIPFQELSGGGILYACDISETMITWMQNNITAEHPEIHPIQIIGDRIPLEDSCADLVFMINLHHELDNPSVLLKEASRLLGEGGKIFIVDWKIGNMEQGPPQNIRCRTEDVSSQLKAAGFKNIIADDSLPKHFLITAEIT